MGLGIALPLEINISILIFFIKNVFFRMPSMLRKVANAIFLESLDLSGPRYDGSIERLIMKGSVILSLALDALAVGIILVPDGRFSGLLPDPKWIRKGKYACAAILLGTGFLIDIYISHPR